VLSIFKTGSHELFTWIVFEPPSSWSLNHFTSASFHLTVKNFVTSFYFTIKYWNIFSVVHLLFNVCNFN
jgi:hypothetical protein